MQDIACAIIKVKGERLSSKMTKKKHHISIVKNRLKSVVIHWNSSAVALN